MALTVVSWNVNGLRARLAHVARYLEARAPDVLCLQETKVSYDDFPRGPLRDLGYHAAVLSSGGYAGVALLVRQPIEADVYGLDGFEAPQPAARRLAARIGGLWIDTVYVPTRLKIGKIAFLDALADDHARRHGPDTHVVLCGDFNLCRDARDMAAPTMISQSNLHPRRPEDLALQRLLEEQGLVDCFRQRCTEGGHYSWFSPTAGAFAAQRGMRLDYVFASAPLAERLIDCVHDDEPCHWDGPSDHLPVRATFDLGVGSTNLRSATRRGDS